MRPKINDDVEDNIFSCNAIIFYDFHEYLEPYSEQQGFIHIIQFVMDIG